MLYETKITLYNSYFDLNNNLSAKSILNIFQDVASIHGEKIGVGYLDMLNKNLYWVLSRIKFDIVKMPQINQTVVVKTWPHEKGKIDFDRDISIFSENGELLIKGTTKWCVIDTISRKLQRTENVTYSGEIHPEKNYEDKFFKITLPEQKFKTKFNYTVLYSDLDHNQHMNNTNYANLILNATENKKFSHFEINFLNECLENDVIHISSTISPSGEFVIGSVADKNVFVGHIK
jgi:acyl-ACP thioesterase